MGKLIGIFALFGAMSVANAAPITGSMGLFGSFAPEGGANLGNTPSLTLVDVFGTNGGSGDLGNVNFFSTGSANNTFDFNPSVAIGNLLTIEGWQLDITNSVITTQNATFLNISGTGIVSCVDTGLCGTNFDATNVNWQLTAQVDQASSSYSLGVTAVPVPAALWLFGSGLIGLVGLVRRRRT